VAFLTGTDRMNLGLLGTKEFVDTVGFHEFAHQWWGHLVGIASYRDTWLEEGFAEFSAALALQHTQGWGAYEKHWREARRELFATNLPGSQIANIDAGPIVEGERLATRKSPYAYQVLIYSKGAYVLHMLRMMMWDFASPVPDARFIAMMKDYASSFAGKSATTADFQKVVERHDPDRGLAGRNGAFLGPVASLIVRPGQAADRGRLRRRHQRQHPAERRNRAHSPGAR
jgi:hypothetical protein